MKQTAVACAASLPLAALFRRRAGAASYGALRPDPEGILDLPPGFSYSVLERKYDDMSDGYRVPARADGMACFAGEGGTYVLMRNHEVSRGDFSQGPYRTGQSAPAEAYDSQGVGGVTRLVVDPNTLERISSNLVLVGTARNCAGGPSPWGWLSCEENTDPGHGYVFLCPADAPSVQMPQRIAGYGRCNHEAVCVDPETHVAYLTEDRNDGCLYRFVPDDPEEPFAGTLQAMKVVGERNLDTSTGRTAGDLFDVEWVDLEEPDPAGDTLRAEAREKGAALVRRGEGIWFFGGAVYVCSTSGGPIGKGQIFALDVTGQTLQLLAQSEDAAVLDNPDNLTVSPWGDVFLAEDGGGDQYLRVLTEDGEVSDFARNALSGSELAGVCFSPDGKVLFVNLQEDGLTLAVRGDFPAVGPSGVDPSNLRAGGGACSAAGGRGLSIGTLAAAAGAALWATRSNRDGDG